MNEHRRGIIVAFARHIVRVELFDFEVINRNSLGMRLVNAGNHRGELVIRLQHSLSGLDVLCLDPLATLNPHMVTVRGLKFVHAPVRRRKLQYPQVISDVLERLHDALRFEHIAAFVARQNEISRPDILDVSPPQRERVCRVRW